MSKRKIISLIIGFIAFVLGVFAYRAFAPGPSGKVPSAQKAFGVSVSLDSVKRVKDGVEVQLSAPAVDENGSELVLGKTIVFGMPLRKGWGLAQEGGISQLKSFFDVPKDAKNITVMQEVRIEHTKLATLEFHNLRPDATDITRKINEGKFVVNRVTINKPIDTKKWVIVYFHGFVEPKKPCIAIEVETYLPPDDSPVASDAVLIDDKGRSYEALQELRTKDGTSNVINSVNTELTLKERLVYAFDRQKGEQEWLSRINAANKDITRTHRLYIFPAVSPEPKNVSFIIPVKMSADEGDIKWVVFRNVQISK